MAGKAASILINILGDARGAVEALDTTESKLAGFGKKVGALGLAAGAAGGAALAVGFADALDAESVTASLQAQLGATASEADELGRIAASVYRDAWGESLADVANTVAAITQSFGDLDSEGIEDATVKAQALADTFGLDVQDAISKTGVLLASGLADDATEAFDLIAATMQQVPAALRGDVLDAAEEYSQFFQQVGLDGEHAMGLLAKGAEDGQYGIDKVGDAVKEFTIRSTDLSSASASAYDALNLNMGDMTNALLAGGDTAKDAFEEIVAGLQGIEDPGEQAAAAIALFGTPLEDLGVAQIPEFLAGLSSTESALQDVGGTAADVADTMGGTTANKIESFKREALGKLADFVAEYVIPKFEQLVAWVEANWPQIKQTALDVFTAIQKAWVTYGQPALDAVIAAAEAVAAFVRDNWPQIKQTALDVFTTVQQIITAFVDVVQTIWRNFGEQIAAFIEAKFQAIMGVIDGLLQVIRGIVQTVTALIHGDWSEAWEGIKAIFEGIWTAIVAAVTGFINEMKAVIDAVLQVISGIWSSAWGGISTAVSGAWDTIKSTVSGGIDEVVGFVTGLPGRVAEVGSTAFQAIIDAFTGAKTFVSDGVGEMMEVIAGIPGTVVTKLGSGFSAIWTSFKDVINKVIRGWNGITFPSFTIGGWDPPGPGPTVPGVTVGGWSVPQIPELHSGGVVPGAIGSESLWMLEAGETVRTRDQEAALGGAFPSHITVMIGAHEFEAVLVAHDSRVADRARAGVR